jgi:2-haloacid dehalogenase
MIPATASPAARTVRAAQGAGGLDRVGGAGSAGMADLTMCRQAWAAMLAAVSCPPANERFLVPERPIIVFDVNETLLDLEAIRPVFDRIFDDPAAMRLWFAGLITYSEALTLAGVYVPFTDIGGAVLRMLAATRGITISDADSAELTDRFATMPPHPEVPAALRRLREHGFRLFTLTDNTLEISGRQLERAGVIDVFERRFSVDETVRRHKPAPEAYHSVAAALTANPGGICLIASHVWDTIGAGAAGWQAALIVREGNAPLDVGPQPDYIGKDLDAIADQLIERYAVASKAG